MKYIHKYYWDGVRNDGTVVRLDIYEKVEDNYPDPSEIEVPRISTFTGASLSLQGGQSDAVSPIIKTTLSFSMVDAWDIPDKHKTRRSGDVVVDYDFEKFGHWEEFYTPDATKYKVVFSENETPRWTGFVTPDSYEEDLNYRGIISVLCRDNIGHLQDFEFNETGDADGMMSIRELVNAALAKIESGMELRLFDVDIQVTDTNNNEINILDSRFNVSAFEDANWYDVLESVLDSYSLCLRYDDDNKLVLCSQRQLPYSKQSGTAALTEKEILFRDGSGHREIIPMAKRIIEEVSYKNEDAIQPLYGPDKVGTNMETYPWKVVVVGSGSILSNSGTGPVWNLTGATPWRTDNPNVLSPSACDTAPGTPDALLSKHLADHEPNWRQDSFMAANHDNGPWRYLVFERTLQHLGITLTVEFGKPVVSRRNPYTDVKPLVDYWEGFWDYSWLSLYQVMFLLSYVQGGTEYFWQGEGEGWSTTRRVHTVRIYDGSTENPDTGTLEFELPEDLPGSGTLRLAIASVEYRAGVGIEAVDIDGYEVGVYSRISSVTIVDKNAGELPKSDKTTVIYADDQANVVINRKPALGTMEKARFMALPSIVRNILYGIHSLGITLPIAKALFTEEGGEYLKYSVLAAKMLLCYRGKSNNMITGDIMADDPRFNNIYTYKGHKLLLVSGTLNIVDGRLNGVTLQEYNTYEELWIPRYKITLMEAGRNELERAVIEQALQSVMGISAAEAAELCDNVPVVLYEDADRETAQRCYDEIEIYSGVLQFERISGNGKIEID